MEEYERKMNLNISFTKQRDSLLYYLTMKKFGRNVLELYSTFLPLFLINDRYWASLKLQNIFFSTIKEFFA